MGKSLAVRKREEGKISKRFLYRITFVYRAAIPAIGENKELRKIHGVPILDIFDKFNVFFHPCSRSEGFVCCDPDIPV
jgi:hypothetical protein